MSNELADIKAKHSFWWIHIHKDAELLLNSAPASESYKPSAQLFPACEET